VRAIAFSAISATKNSKNQVWKEKSVENVGTLGPTAQGQTSNHNERSL
jgi:hypothetical protein